LLRRETIDKVKVSEISEAGSVPELKVHNTLDVRVFLMDGQELIGARQNRILNTDVLVPANSTLIIPVSCVEAGRWRHESAIFTPGKSASHRIRAAKAARVHDSLKCDKRHDADQGAVWEEVSESLHASMSHSPTSCLSDAYLQRARELAELRKGITPPDMAVGLAVFQNGAFQGLDLFDRHSTLRYFWESLVDSYTIDFLAVAREAHRASDSDESAAVSAALEHAATANNWEPFDSPGEGQDWRMSDGQMSGSALVWEDRVVLHLQLFPRAQQSSPGAARSRAYRPRIHRPYVSGQQNA
jgi:hypothetical protein